MEDPRFNGAVILICEHTQEGAMGVVINKPTQQSFGHLCLRMGVENHNTTMGEKPVYYGGPVHPERGLVLHQPLGEWSGTFNVGNDFGISHSRDIFDAIRLNQENRAPQQALLALGYAGWGAGQLEQEMVANAWINVPIQDPATIVFATPVEHIRTAVLKQAGINPTMLAGVVGHA